MADVKLQPGQRLTLRSSGGEEVDIVLQGAVPGRLSEFYALNGTGGLCHVRVFRRPGGDQIMVEKGGETYRVVG